MSKLNKKKRQAWKRRSVKMPQTCKPGNRGRKNAKHATTTQKNNMQMLRDGHFFRFFMVSAMAANFCIIYIYIFLRFGRSLFPGWHVFGILAGRRFRACVSFAFLVVLGLLVAFCPASAAPAQKMQQACSAKCRQGSKHENNADSQCKTYAKHMPKSNPKR